MQLEAGFYETGFKLGHPWVQRLYREAAAQYGLELISIVMNDLDRHGLRHGRGTEFGDIAYEGLDIALEAAAAMEIPVLMIPSFLNNDMRTEQDVEHTIEALQLSLIHIYFFKQNIQHRFRHFRKNQVGRPKYAIFVKRQVIGSQGADISLIP